VRSFDLPDTQNLTGEFLMTTGLTVLLPARGSAILSYDGVAGQGEQQLSAPELEKTSRKNRRRSLHPAPRPIGRHRHGPSHSHGTKYQVD